MSRVGIYREKVVVVVVVDAAAGWWDADGYGYLLLLLTSQSKFWRDAKKATWEK